MDSSVPAECGAAGRVYVRVYGCGSDQHGKLAWMDGIGREADGNQRFMVWNNLRCSIQGEIAKSAENHPPLNVKGWIP